MEIDIIYGKFLAPIFDAYAHASFSEDEMLTRVEERRAAWQQEEERLLAGMQEVTGLTFFENRIPVYVVGSYEGAFSDPIVISSRTDSDWFVDVLTHELIHRLGDYNTQGVKAEVVTVGLFSDITDSTILRHVFVHAVHAHLYLEVLGDANRLKRDVERGEEPPEYREAWNVVEQTGYQNILNDFRGHKGRPT
ncbi:MAG: hypothetical protein WD850_03100 [Candidatus Spechtbacterales bacterium]